MDLGLLLETSMFGIFVISSPIANNDETKMTYSLLPCKSTMHVLQDATTKFDFKFTHMQDC